MNCPQCNVTLLMAERQSVEIDYCPQCRGIWLDRGELEKIIERSSSIEASYSGSSGFPPPFRDHSDDTSRYKHSDDHHDDHHGSTGYGQRRKKGFLGELFDF
jgi:Zn-finger nucleic acid-binding protein